MVWTIKFTLTEVDRITISCHGIRALEWHAGEGEVFKYVPTPWGNIPNNVHFRADGHPNGRQAHCEFYWAGILKHIMDFDNGAEWHSKG
jgi:hypothetical protein